MAASAFLRCQVIRCGRFRRGLVWAGPILNCWARPIVILLGRAISIQDKTGEFIETRTLPFIFFFSLFFFPVRFASPEP